MAVVNILYCLQGLCQTGRRICNLSIRQHLSRTDCIQVTELPGIHTAHLCQKIDIHLRCKTGLCHAKASESSRRRIVGVNCLSVNVDHLIIIRSCCMGTGSLEHRPSKRCVSSRISHYHSLHSCKTAVFITGSCQVNAHGMTLWMHQNTFLTGQLYLNGPLCNIGNQRCLMLNRYVLLAAEAAAYQHIFYDYLFRRKAQKDRSFMTGIVGTLIGRINQHAAVKWHGNCTFRLQKCMLCPGSLIMAGYFVFGCSNHFICISPHQMLMA